MNGKERLLNIYFMLKQDTDEDRPLSTPEIVDHFTALGIATDRKTVREDIKALIDCGINIVTVQGVPTKYFYDDRPFELPELKLLIDAVESSKFITAKKSDALVHKLTALTSRNNADELKRHLYTAGRIKPENESIYYVVDAIHAAINKGQKISFLYYEYDENRQRVPRHNGEPFILSPYAMLYNEDKYYVLGFSDYLNKTITLRVDRMGVPTILEEQSRPAPEGFDPVDYTINIFSMYSGETTTPVELLCENQLMNYVIDRFGDEAKTRIVDGQHFMAEVEISVSQTFFAWVFQFAGGIRITSPEPVVDRYREMLKKAAE